MNIILVTTCVMSPGRTEMLERMLNSVTRADAKLGDKHNLKMILLLQKYDGVLTPLPRFVQISTIPNMVSVSAARNIMLRPLLENETFTPDTLVAFPDDDCWYPDGILESIVERFERNEKLDFFFCRYGSVPVDATQTKAAQVVSARIGHVVRNSSSNTIFLRGPTMAKTGLFDEALGVGTPNGGAEDLNIALEAFLVARETEFLDRPLIGHRDKDNGMRARYYRSGVLVLRRFSGRGAMKEYLRKILVGFYLVFRGELSLHGLFRALTAADLPIKA